MLDNFGEIIYNSIIVPILYTQYCIILTDCGISPQIHRIGVIKMKEGGIWITDSQQ
jgi:hypothetical protein